MALGWLADPSEDVVVDAARRALAVAHRDGRGAIGWHGVATREHATLTRHHRRDDLDDAVGDDDVGSLGQQ